MNSSTLMQACTYLILIWVVNGAIYILYTLCMSVIISNYVPRISTELGLIIGPSVNA